MLNSNNARAVIFDLDGTLYYLRKTRVRLTLKLWRHIGVLRHIGGARNAMRARRFEAGELFTATFSEELGRRTKLGADPAWLWYREVFYPAFLELLERRAFPRPGLLQLLAQLRSAGVKLGIVSDFSWIEERLRAIGIPPEAFDDLLSTEELGQLKPSPKGLLVVAQGWGIQPEEVIVVGDRVDRDAEAAKAAGMTSIIVDNHPPSSGHRTRKGVTLLPWAEVMERVAERTGISRPGGAPR